MTDTPSTPYIEPTEHSDNPEAKAVLDYIREKSGRITNLHRLNAYSPQVARASFDLAMALRYDVSVPRDLTEFCILRTAQLAKSAYVLRQHGAMALKVGIAQEKIDALADYATSPLFSDAERVALQFTDSVFTGETLAPDEFAKVREHFSPAQIVEIIRTIGAYFTTCRFLSALAVTNPN